MGVKQRVGVIGGGQLAWMMGPAAQRLGLDLVVQTPQATDPAAAIATAVILAPVADAQATLQLAQQCDVITFENEFVDLEALAALSAQGIEFAPALTALKPLLDKYEQRSFLAQHQLPNPRFVALADREDPQHSPFGFPVMLKARRLGYDGKGTQVINTATELAAIVNEQGAEPFLLEEYVPFECELAVMAARSRTGQIAIYPIVETQQVDHVCRRVIAPAVISPVITAKIRAIATTILDHLNVVGVFGIELFLTQAGEVLVNELAPRTHNSGHYSLDACQTSQFEQQLRAVTGLPLGNPDLTCAGAVMVNLLGFETATLSAKSVYEAKLAQLAALPNAHVYWYNKTDSKPGRKLGHVTVLFDGADQGLEAAQTTALKLEEIWYA
ncbi:MAG: 5-(carboxyamino)imidazole ribonucleotide synthase [Cyanobacteria bacterium P01_H01_bin.121]